MCPWCSSPVAPPEGGTATPSACPRCDRELPSGQAPGNPGWTRAFAESAAAQREPFSDAEERLRGLAASHWSGQAHDAFLVTRDRLVGEWRAARDIHDAVARRVDGHNQYVHELQHLWEADRGIAGAQLHSADVYRRAVASLADELLRRAAELDTVAAKPLRPEPPAAATAMPEPRASAGPDPERGRERRPERTPEAESKPESESDSPPEPEPAEESASPDTEADRQMSADDHPVFRIRRQSMERLEEELRTGERFYLIKWEDGPAA
ncbi:hypothetical protein AB0G02_09575 [Actinosynnema sp. NPDC023658]|uniref:hypothetical protein n=1 Tax=Actinosynnema sp. NPDC023658 TaxID=3155465 RepID=UPI0033F52323